jgi:hypothetical protein
MEWKAQNTYGEPGNRWKTKRARREKTHLEKQGDSGTRAQPLQKSAQGQADYQEEGRGKKTRWQRRQRQTFI